MQLTIENVKTNPSGKSETVKAGGKDYLVKSGSGLQAGMTVEAETEISDYKGKTNIWIQKWKQVAAATQTQQGGTSGGSGTASYMPFVSNTVAHAISAGLIQNPSQIESWAVAARLAAYKVETDCPF